MMEYFSFCLLLKIMPLLPSTLQAESIYAELLSIRQIPPSTVH